MNPIDSNIVIDIFNHFLLNSEDKYTSERLFARFLGENILRSTDNYHGIRYLTVKDMQESKYGTIPGINESHVDGTIIDYMSKFEKCDLTRIAFRKEEFIR